MPSFKKFFILLLLLPCLFMAGCASALVAGGVAAGAAIAYYVKGDLVSQEPVALDTAFTAAKTAMREMDYTVTEESRGSLTATILASHPAEKPVEIHLQKEAVHFTKIKIRIGVFGNEALSRQILKEIQEQIEQQERF